MDRGVTRLAALNPVAQSVEVVADRAKLLLPPGDVTVELVSAAPIPQSQC